MQVEGAQFNNVMLADVPVGGQRQRQRPACMKGLGLYCSCSNVVLGPVWGIPGRLEI